MNVGSGRDAFHGGGTRPYRGHLSGCQRCKIVDKQWRFPDLQPQNVRTKRLKAATCIPVACVSGLVGALGAQPGTPLAANDDPALRPADYQPSGDYYDWRKTGKPERPWLHKYDQSLVMKIFLAERTGAAGFTSHSSRRWR